MSRPNIFESQQQQPDVAGLMVYKSYSNYYCIDLYYLKSHWLLIGINCLHRLVWPIRSVPKHLPNCPSPALQYEEQDKEHRK